MQQNNINRLSNFVKQQRGKLRITQEALALKAGVGLRFIRDLEQGKESLRLDKVNQVLALFGYSTGAVNDKTMDIYEVLLNNMNRAVKLTMKNREERFGIILEYVPLNMGIDGWKFVNNNDAKEYQKSGAEGLVQFIPNDLIDGIENIGA